MPQDAAAAAAAGGAAAARHASTPQQHDTHRRRSRHITRSSSSASSSVASHYIRGGVGAASVGGRREAVGGEKLDASRWAARRATCRSPEIPAAGRTATRTIGARTEHTLRRRRSSGWTAVFSPPRRRRRRQPSTQPEHPPACGTPVTPRGVGARDRARMEASDAGPGRSMHPMRPSRTRQRTPRPGAQAPRGRGRACARATSPPLSPLRPPSPRPTPPKPIMCNKEIEKLRARATRPALPGRTRNPNVGLEIAPLEAFLATRSPSAAARPSPKSRTRCST